VLWNHFVLLMTLHSISCCYFFSWTRVAHQYQTNDFLSVDLKIGNRSYHALISDVDLHLLTLFPLQTETGKLVSYEVSPQEHSSSLDLLLVLLRLVLCYVVSSGSFPILLLMVSQVYY